MPFNTTDTLPDNPDVRIFFSGLMIIQPDETGETCEVFVNRAALNHRFSARVTEKREGKPDIVLMRTPCEFSFLPPEISGDQIFGMEITGNPAKGLERYTGSTLPGGEETFDLAIDLDDKTLHGRTLDINKTYGRPSILLNTGIFYTAESTPAEMVVLIRRNLKETRMRPFASLIGVNVYLENKEETLSIRWSELGCPRTLKVEKKEGSRYEIYIHNDPLFVDPEAGEAHDEFGEYYKMLEPIQPQERVELKIDVKSSPKGTPETVCMTVVKGGGS